MLIADPSEHGQGDRAAVRCDEFRDLVIRIEHEHEFRHRCAAIDMAADNRNPNLGQAHTIDVVVVCDRLDATPSGHFIS